MVVTLFNVDNREISRNRHTRRLEGTKHSRHRSEHVAVQTDDNDSEKETLMIGVHKKLMLMRNKRSDKDWGAEEEYNDEDRSDNGGCSGEADEEDDDDDKEERIDKTYSEKAEINEEERSDNDQCAEGTDDDDKEERIDKTCS